MKKEIVNCDMCGAIIQAPGVGRMRHIDGEVNGAIPHPRGLYNFYTLDLCEDDWPHEVFDGAITVLYGGECVEGEMIDLRERSIFAVVVEDRDEGLTESLPVTSLSSEKRSYIDRVERAFTSVWDEMEMENPRYERH